MGRKRWNLFGVFLTMVLVCAGDLAWPLTSAIAAEPVPFPPDPQQPLERTCFQTGQGYSDRADLRSDVAIVYGIDSGLPKRIESWRERGYRIHVMTGVSWGQYQDYLYGRFDGIHHEDEAQTDRRGKKISHGGDVYYMCPGENYGKFLCVGIQRALDAGAEAIHLEEPEFWVRGGYSEGFKREWRKYYSEDWKPPHETVDAAWRSSKLKYFLYRRALQQVFDYVQEYNHRAGRKVRCYVPTHSLLSYAQWRIVSPESSLARLNGCDGYIAQVWTGTARTPNRYRGQWRERTFETAFLEYGAMQNLVRSTGRSVWYLNDPIEDNPNHDWQDYKMNWESTLVASLFQPEVWQYEVAPWPERIFGGRYPRRSANPEPIPQGYATELQTVMNALNDMKQPEVSWDCGTTGIGVMVSDSLMFERGEPTPSDPDLGQVYGLALPLLKRGMPVSPVQLENVTAAGYLDRFKILLLSYDGMKPLSSDVHGPLADWVKRGGVLVICDDDADPYNKVREWWNSSGKNYQTPREHLFEGLGISGGGVSVPGSSGLAWEWQAGSGTVVWMHRSPAGLAGSPNGDTELVSMVKRTAEKQGVGWRETNYLLLRRGPYVIASGLDESIGGGAKELQGRYVNLFDPELRVEHSVPLDSGARLFLVDLEKTRTDETRVIASACKTLRMNGGRETAMLAVEGVANTKAVVLMSVRKAPRSITLDGQTLANCIYSEAEHLLWIRFANESLPRELKVEF